MRKISDRTVVARARKLYRRMMSREIEPSGKLLKLLWLYEHNDTCAVKELRECIS